MIIPVTKENEQIWAELCVALWPEDTFDSFIKWGEKNNYEGVYLSLIEDEAVACLWISLRYEYVGGTNSHEDSRPVGFLEGIYVKSEYRKQGIAREFVEFAKKWAVEKGCTEFASSCDIDNDVSRKFHNKIGFKEVEIGISFVMNL
jgi:aminoglycoside 6'-N-acetyltransferase I